MTSWYGLIAGYGDFDELGDWIGSEIDVWWTFGDGITFLNIPIP
jgi:hypothetical protein